MDISAELQNHISLKERTRKHVKIYFQKTQDAEIKRMLPSTVRTEEEALKAFEETQRSDATSFGRTNYQVKELGAFLYAANAASRRVLEKNGFAKAETIVEDGVESFYYEWKL